MVTIVGLKPQNDWRIRTSAQQCMHMMMLLPHFSLFNFFLWDPNLFYPFFFFLLFFFLFDRARENIFMGEASCPVKAFLLFPPTCKVVLLVAKMHVAFEYPNHNHNTYTHRSSRERQQRWSRYLYIVKKFHPYHIKQGEFCFFLCPSSLLNCADSWSHSSFYHSLDPSFISFNS